MKSIGLVVFGVLFSVTSFAGEMDNGYSALLKAYQAHPELQSISPICKADLSSIDQREILSRLSDAGVEIQGARDCRGFFCGEGYGMCVAPCSCSGEGLGGPGTCQL